jgi:hypothetical protein
VRIIWPSSISASELSTRQILTSEEVSVLDGSRVLTSIEIARELSHTANTGTPSMTLAMIREGGEHELNASTEPDRNIDSKTLEKLIFESVFIVCILHRASQHRSRSCCSNR